ncbi:MAG: 3-phosphoserine/phosphohydroxythreonine transaminase [Candidatus Hydrogenedentes bacterium]|nr:3-phosphoserine/phosphohydroxythreonine transaminase [Candidatus Hydrogenedentota bacterium]
MSHILNFNPGPAILPKEVLLEAQNDLLDYAGTGISVLESSHRSPEFVAIQEEAETNLRALLAIPDSYAVLFLQGGASQQFALAPMNLLHDGQTADYTNSGAWAKKAIAEAKRIGNVNVIADTNEDRPTRVPDPGELDPTPGAAYLHITCNETISGAQWKTFPNPEAPLVADMSSEILSRKIDIDRFGLIYAGAQKNLGPSGLTVVIVRKDLAENAPADIPAIFRYQAHIDAGSMFNTPPCFGVYLLMLVTRWVEQRGGLAARQRINEEKAARLYCAIDATGFYRGTAHIAHRSTMNVTFNLSTEELEEQFASEAAAAGLKGLKGHRSVGGLRASIYNAFPLEGVDALVSFMQDFERRNG